ncbi:MAG: ribosome silencing factor [Armatimonadia bacterium]
MSLDSREKALAIAEIADKHGALDMIILDMRDVMTITDYFIICHGRSKVHCQALAEHIEEEMSKRDIHVKHREGAREGYWVILDYLDVVVHIFEEEARHYYDLRRLWMEAPEVEMPQPV